MYVQQYMFFNSSIDRVNIIKSYDKKYINY